MGRRIPPNHRAGADGGPFSHRHRGDEGRIGANEGAIANPGQVFVDAVVIAGDGPGANVHPAPDLGVANVAEMADLGPLANLGLLDLDKVADMDLVRQIGLGSIRA